jgi:hypothetical protein
MKSWDECARILAVKAMNSTPFRLASIAKALNLTVTSAGCLGMSLLESKAQDGGIREYATVFQDTSGRWLTSVECRLGFPWRRLGYSVLVAPLAAKGTNRRVVLPKGKWLGDDGKTLEGGKTYTLDVPLSRIPFFRRAE